MRVSHLKTTKTHQYNNKAQKAFAARLVLQPTFNFLGLILAFTLILLPLLSLPLFNLFYLAGKHFF